MWWRADPQDLYRLTDRLSSLYIERTHIDRDENAVVLINKERTVRVPAALVAVIMLGPGTRITHGAVNLLADSGTAICWVGEHGVRCYANGIGTSRSSSLLLRQAYLVTRRNERLNVARRMYGRRFPGEDVSSLTMQQLRGREGARIRRLYSEHSKRTGIKWSRREYQPGEPFAAGDDVNRLLSAAHSCLYGVCHAAIVGIGASPGLGFVHTGGALSFVHDIADLYKAEYTIPLAFDLAASGHLEERDARLAFRDKLVDGRLLHRITTDVVDLLQLDPQSTDNYDVHELWDERAGTVQAGINWASDKELGSALSHHVVTGPELAAQDPSA